MENLGKITVKFFLHKKVAPKVSPWLDNVDCYPLYIQVSYARNNTQFRSFYKNIYSSIDQAYENDIELINYEECLISKVLEYEIKTLKEKFELKGIGDRYMDYAMGVDHYVDSYLRQTFYNTLISIDSEFNLLLDPFNEKVDTNIYYKAAKKLINNLDSYFPKFFVKEIEWGTEFINWCKDQKELPRIIDWLNRIALNSYEIYLKNRKFQDDIIRKRILFINKIIKITTKLDIL